LLAVASGAVGVSALRDLNAVTTQIREDWLPSTRFLGDINNYTSDFRAAEGTLLLSGNNSDVAASEREIAELDVNIAKARVGYAGLRHGAKEAGLYQRFERAWETYRKIAGSVIADVRTRHIRDGIRTYKTHSKRAYDAASDTLGLLTDLNVSLDQEASDRAAVTYERARIVTLAAMLAIALIVVAVTTYIRRAISAPMLDLAANMRKIAQNSMAIAIQGTDRRDEIGEMARAIVVFRENAIDLALSRQGLIQQADMLAEKLRHERRLIAAQGNFISTASHEFRTPLNIIDGHAQRLIKLNAHLNPADVAERAAKIRAAVKRLTDLIDNLIHGTRLFEDHLNLYFHPAPLDFSQLLGEVCNDHREMISGATIELDAKGPLNLSGDEGLMRQMVGNLLSNAIKYSPNGGCIGVGAWREGDEIIVRVRDQGIGIPTRDVDTVDLSRFLRQTVKTQNPSMEN